MTWSRDFFNNILILGSFHLDSERRYWIKRIVIERNIRDISVDFGQKGTDVKILLTMSNNTLTVAKEDIKC